VGAFDEKNISKKSCASLPLKRERINESEGGTVARGG
jgi:hypothetical protein